MLKIYLWKLLQQIAKIKNPKKKNCKQTKKDKKTENKDTCSKKNFKSTLDELYCYKELYDKNGKEKFRGQVKFSEEIIVRLNLILFVMN